MRHITICNKDTAILVTRGRSTRISFFTLLRDFHILPSMLQSKILIVQFLERLELEGQQLIAKCRVKSLTEQLLLIFIIGHIPGCIARQTSKLTPLGFNIPAPLSQIQKFPPFEIHDGLRDIRGTECCNKLFPSNNMYLSLQTQKTVPPNTSITFHL